MHLSFVRSTTLDTWTEDQLALMAVGGNQRARTFFKQHGWDEIGSDKIEAKYTSRAAQLYRKQLEKEANKMLRGESGAPSTLAASSSATNLTSKAATQTASLTGSTAASTASSTSTTANTTIPAATSLSRSTAASTKARLGARKVGGRAGGLGIKKIAADVDDSLFEQAPEETKAESTTAPDSTDADEFEDALPAPTSSRFAMDALEEKKRVAPARGKDGHLTLDTSSDFFADPIGKSSGGLGRQDSLDSAKKPFGGSNAPLGARPNARGTKGSTKAAVEPEIGAAQARFGNAKSISSSAFFNEDEQDNSFERSAKLSQFQGSTSISSDAYFGRESRNAGGGDALDITAADMIGRIGLNARQDVEQLKVMASEATTKLSRMAQSFIRDLQGGY